MSRPDPIPIESLTPISKNDPRAQVKFDGKSLPKTPGMRHVKPKPFQRQSINISRHGREWRMIRADAVEEGEMVVGVGRVVEKRVVVRYKKHVDVTGTPGRDVAVGTDIMLTGMGGSVGIYDAAEQVRTFAKKDEQD